MMKKAMNIIYCLYVCISISLENKQLSRDLWKQKGKKNEQRIDKVIDVIAQR
jgi:hypothetical protein